MMSPKIAIIGAGPGGCMLARLLTRHNISCTIFEADHSPDYRSQGGTLDLRAGTGLKAIQEAGLFESFQERARYDGESLVICDKKQTTWLRRYPSKQGEKNSIQEAPEIDRAALREMLMDSLPEGIVRWGHRLKSIGEDLSLRFENGNVETGFDLIVGADGAFSKTRSFLSSQQPMYTGLGGWSLSIPNAEVLAPDVYKLVNRGSVFCFSDGKNVNAQQLGDGSISVSYWSRFDEHYTSRCGFDPRDLGLVKQKLRGELHDWAPELKNLVEKAEGEPVWRNLYMLPVGFTWEHKCGVTLLGDAAHLMAPFAGIGVNTAFYDATLLADAIIDYTKSGKPENLDKHVIEYEEKMFALGHEAQRLTEGVMLDMQFTPGAPRTSIESYVLKFMYKEFPHWPRFLLKIAVYTIYAIYKLFV